MERWGAREAPKTPRERRPPGAHSRHLRGALIGPRGWRECAPKRRPNSKGKAPPGRPFPSVAGALIGPRGWREWAAKKRPKRRRKGALRAPIPVNRGGLDRPPRFTGMGTQKAPKAEGKRRLPGAHSPHPRGALIGPSGWRQWTPESRPKRREKRAPQAPILVTRGGP